MHTDRKIGFALGILLVGIVAALFFRNEPLLPTDRPAVRREQELNQRLKERDVAIYVDEDSAGKSGATKPEQQPWTLRDILATMGRRNKGQPTPVDGGGRNSARLDGRPPRSLDGFRSVRESDDDPPSGPQPAEATDSSVQEQLAEQHELPPLPPVGPVTSGQHPAGPATDPETDPLPPEASPVSEFQPPAEFDEYVIRYGDTLSGIAQRMLGSQLRYQEIYEANRDRMTSPDQLQVGKSLRIPRVASR